MKFIFILGLVIFYYFPIAFAQISQDRVRFIPKYLNQNQPTKLCYSIDSSIFNNKSAILCKIFFTGTNEDVSRQDFPKVLELNLLEENRCLCGYFDVPAKATGIVAVFQDSLEVNIDNNNGEGYWTPIYIGADLLPGSLSSIADLYAGGWPQQFHLKQKKDIARKLYETDFELHPEIKRKFTRYYLATFDIYDANDKERFIKELNQYSQYKDLNEWELLLGVKRYYLLINEIDSAKKYEKLVFERYPNGSWALQVNSLNPAMQIDLIKSHEKKWEKYKEFKGEYCKSYPDELTRNQMQNRLGQILRGMVLSFAQNSDLVTWQKEVDALDEWSKYYTYKRTATFLTDHLKSSSSIKGKKGDITAFKPEGLLRIKTSNEEQLILYAEKLALESVAWYRQNLDSSRRVIDWLFLTDKEVSASRKEWLAKVLDDLGQNLLLQNRLEEAHQVFKEALDLAKKMESSINEHYIESLIKSNQIDEAIKEAAIVIRLGKSTAAINNFHESMVKDASPKEEAMADLSAQLKKQMISDEMPDGILLNIKGEKIDLKEYKGKTVVIDFWATWCAPCIIGMEFAIEVVEKYKSQKDVVFFFVNTERITDETKVRVNRKLQEIGYNFNVFFDPDFKATNAFKVEVLPTTVIIDSKGKIRFRHSGIDMKSGKQEQNNKLTAMIELVR